MGVSGRRGGGDRKDSAVRTLDVVILVILIVHCLSSDLALLCSPAPCCRPSLKVKLARTVVKDLSSTYLNRIVLLCSQQTKPAHPTGVV